MPTKRTIISAISLFVFAGIIVSIWMTPVWLAGFPYNFTPLISAAKQASIAGQIPRTINPFFTTQVQVLQHIIDWQNTTAWALVSALNLAGAAIALWLTVRRLFSEYVAWATITAFCLMPMYWEIAIDTGYYALALLCLMVGLAVFVHLKNKHRKLAIMALGLCYGLTVATTHAFVPLAPWFGLVYFWEYRKNIAQAFVDLSLFGLIALVAFTTPLWPQVLEADISTHERITKLLPINNHLMPDEEFYGDDYAARFLVNDVKQELKVKAEKGSLLEKLNSAHRRINHNVGKFNFIEVLISSTWLLFNAITSLFMQEITGGAFIWLLIIPGIIVLWKKDRTRTIELIGLWVSMELILRFGFRYGRHHLMDIGWILALFIGLGTVHLSKALAKYFNLKSSVVITTCIIAITAFQLIQSNRMLLAKRYARSLVPKAMAIAEATNALPAEAAIAIPNKNFNSLIIRPTILLHTNTINTLHAQKKLAEPFEYYKITHVIGYSDQQNAIIKESVPNIQVLPVPTFEAIQLNPMKRYILNLIR